MKVVTTAKITKPTHGFVVKPKGKMYALLLQWWCNKNGFQLINIKPTV